MAAFPAAPSLSEARRPSDICRLYSDGRPGTLDDAFGRVPRKRRRGRRSRLNSPEILELVGVDEAHLRRRFGLRRARARDGAGERAERQSGYRRDRGAPRPCRKAPCGTGRDCHPARGPLGGRQSHHVRRPTDVALESAAVLARLEVSLEELLLQRRELAVQAQRRPLSRPRANAALSQRVSAGHTSSDEGKPRRLDQAGLHSSDLLQLEARAPRARAFGAPPPRSSTPPPPGRRGQGVTRRTR
jgi:hypothetical protein